MTPTRHSYSSISCHGICPAMYSYRYIQKLAEESTGAMLRGTRLHSLAETYLKAPSQVCPFELRKIGLLLYQMREKGALSEHTWYVSKHWRPMAEAAAENAKIKCVVDVHYVIGDVLHIHDFKSGQSYPSHRDQLELYSVVGLQVYPKVKRVESSAIYIDSGTQGAERSMIRDMLPHYMKVWEGKMHAIELDTKFDPTPGNHCKWCRFGQSKGGPCKSEQTS